jgi:hypothetical protein
MPRTNTNAPLYSELCLNGFFPQYVSAWALVPLKSGMNRERASSACNDQLAEYSKPRPGPALGESSRKYRYIGNSVIAATPSAVTAESMPPASPAASTAPPSFRRNHRMTSAKARSAT